MKTFKITAMIIFCLALSLVTQVVKAEKIEFDESKIWIEINDTDGDSGLQMKLDGEGWKSVKIFDPKGKKIFQVKGLKGVKKTGLTELFFESAEPGFDELPLAEFLKRFPEGTYKFRGRSVEGDKMRGSATLSHTLPDAPAGNSPAEDSVQNPANTVITWQSVTNPTGSQITKYEVIVEEDGDQDDPRSISAILPPSATSFTVPPEFLASGEDYKYEIVATETSGNRTLVEVPFKTS